MAIWEGRELAHRSPQPQLLARGVRYAGKQAAKGRRQVPPRRRRSATLFGRHRRGHGFLRLANTSICSPAIRWKCTDQAVIVQYMHSIEDLAGQPPIDGLAAFEAVADAGSFSKAAFLLRTTHSTVSRRLAAVEHWVGFKLVERSPRGVELTPDGQAYLTDVRRALALIWEGRESRRDPRGGERVALATPASFASFVLFPLLVRLEQQPTPLRIDLAIGNRLTDFAGERVDLAIRRGIGPWPDVVSLPIYQEHLIPVATGDFAARLGADPAPVDLLAFSLLHDAAEQGWRQWFAAHGHPFRGRPRDRQFGDHQVVLDAAGAGLGIALARMPLSRRALQQQALRPVHTVSIPGPRAFHLVRPRLRLRAVAVELVRRLTRELGIDSEHAARFLG
jgi:LysR family transcriptional regulator, glycine cleavage system transcriptional activator